MAWDLTGAGKHVVRLGYGLYYGQIFQNITLFMEQQANAIAVLDRDILRIASHPEPPAEPPAYCLAANCFRITASASILFRRRLPGGAQLPTGATGRLVDQTYRNPYSEQANGGYSWQVTSDSVIEVEYIHELGLHESKSIVINPKINGVRNTDAPLAAAGLPVLGEIQDYDSIGRSRYDAMNLSYRKRLSKNFSINASYVLSRGLAYNGQAAAFGNGPTDELNWFAPHDLGPDAGGRNASHLSSAACSTCRSRLQPRRSCSGRPGVLTRPSKASATCTDSAADKELRTRSC